MPEPQARPEPPSITCKLGALTPAQRARHAALVRELMGELPTATFESEHGYEFQYARKASTLAKLAEWIEFESQCCEFFSFDISIAPQNGPIRLKWYGTERAAKDIITTTVAPVNATVAKRLR